MLLAAVAGEVVPVLGEVGQAPWFRIIDGTGIRIYGKHSVGVTRQYALRDNRVRRHVV